MKMFITLLLALNTVCIAKADPQYDLTGRFGVGIGIGLPSVVAPDRFKNGATELDGSLLGSFWARYHFDKRLGVELAYTRLSFDYPTSVVPAINNLDPVSDLVMVNAAYRAWPEEIYHLLLQLGVGYARNTDYALSPDDKKDDVVFGARVGFEYMATKDLALAVHADYYSINMGSGSDSKLDVWAPMLAMTYYFGGFASNPAKSAGPLAKPDTDKDGIDDSVDRCPGTPAGQKVTEYGCAQTEKLEITLNVQFASGKSVVDPKYNAELKKFADFMTAYPQATAEIEGHTDNTGSEKLNYSISQRRAEAVRKYLINTFKIDKKRLTAKGFGPSQPLGDNATEAGRTQNRRVVAHVKTDVEKK